METNNRRQEMGQASVASGWLAEEGRKGEEKMPEMKALTFSPRFTLGLN